MTDRNRTLLAMAIGALIVVGAVAGFSIAEHGWGDDDEGAACDTTDFIVFLRPQADSATVEDVGRFLEAEDGVRSIHYLDEAATLADFRELFADQPEMIDRVDAAMLPTSYRVDLEESEPAAAIEQRVRNEVGDDVFDVVSTGGAFPEVACAASEPS